jgi:branched-chain amino acid transport system permease protein
VVKDGKFVLVGRHQAAPEPLLPLAGEGGEAPAAFARADGFTPTLSPQGRRRSWFIDYTVNGLIIGNIYALLAVGLALIFGVANLINFAHGSVYTVGAYIGWAADHLLHTPLPLTLLLVFVGCALLGVAIERIGLRPLQGRARIAPLLATIGISFVLDQLVQLICSPDPRALPSDLPDWRFQIGGGTIGALDLLIAGIGLTSARLLFVFLRFTKLGWAVRATAQDRDAAQQMGVDVDAVNSAVFAIASALGGLSAACWSACITTHRPGMSFQATLKGVVAVVIGGVGNVPGAIVGSLLLGLVESYGIALFGTSYRNLFAFVLLIAIPGLAAQRPVRRRRAAARAADRHLHRAAAGPCACRAGGLAR